MKTKNLYPNLTRHQVPSADPLRDTYLAERYGAAHKSNGVYRVAYKPAHEALAAARAYYEPAPGGKIYGGKYKFAPRFARGYGSNQISESGKLWIEDLDCAGLRFLGYADKVSRRLGHTGWYMTEENRSGETARGAVLQMAARRGRPQYVPAMESPHNPGTFLVDFASITPGIYGGAGECDPVDDDGVDTAAAVAMADDYAEDARRYDVADNAGREYARNREEASDARKEARELLEDVRTWRRWSVGGKLHHAESAVCDALATARNVARRADKAARELAKEWRAPGGCTEYAKGRLRLAWAFAEGAGMDQKEAESLLGIPAGNAS